MQTRRQFLYSAPALIGASKLFGQARPTPLAARKLSQMTLTVSDVKRSVEFYQGLFGAPIQARQGTAVILRVGMGPQYLALRQGSAPSSSSYGISVEGFKADRVVKALLDLGLTKSDSDGARKVRRTTRGNTPEVFVGDPDGIVIQLQDPSYCGGTGALGNTCAAAEAAPQPGLMSLRDLSHFTLSTSDAQRSRDFYTQVFGMAPQAYQGAGAPVLGLGSSRHFIMAAAGGGVVGQAVGAQSTTARIGHGCFSVDAFGVDKVLKLLADYGVKPRGDATGPAKPLVSYVSMRMENRGGAKEGTAELYFTDPDGILLQLQDPSYCGGGGVLGEVCLV